MIKKFFLCFILTTFSLCIYAQSITQLNSSMSAIDSHQSAVQKISVLPYAGKDLTFNSTNSLNTPMWHNSKIIC